MPNASNSLPPFTCIGDTVDLWPEPESLMSYGEANALGRERGAQLIDVIRRTGSPSLLGHIADAIFNAGRMGGVEIGFFHAVSTELINPATIREFVEVPTGRNIHATRQMGLLRIVA